MHALDFSLPQTAIRRMPQLCIAVAALLALSGLPLCAQTDTGSIIGIVQDKSGARLA